MPAGRSTKTLGRRRRIEDEGEDEEGPVILDDSMSEGSGLGGDSEGDDEVETSSVGAGERGVGEEEEENHNAVSRRGSTGKITKKAGKRGGKKLERTGSAQDSRTSAQAAQTRTGGFKATADTEAMMKGLAIQDTGGDSEAVEFEGAAAQTSTTAPKSSSNGRHEVQTAGERLRRDHEDYRRKRDADPAFIPNRGNFFMHDTRSHQGQGGPPLRGAYGGRGRGRGGQHAGPPFQQGNYMGPVEKAAEQPWKHDLHDTINEAGSSVGGLRGRDDANRLFPRPQLPHANQQKVLSFSNTKLVGKVQIRVFLAGMKAPIVFSEVPWKSYTRLPDHRPPLRRDKPVRVSLPEQTQRYIFPSPERSFIFIPRQMRPNQQGFGRNAYQRSNGGHGYSSRRTSMYGGSMYAASIAASRRSSFASVSRDNAFSPVGSYGGGPMPPSRNMGRMSHGGSQSHLSATGTPMGPLSGPHTPTGMQMYSFPLPQQPTFQGTPTTTVHQPRPQKTISVTGIESPAALQTAPGGQEVQPFQNQLPAHMIDQQQQPGFHQPPPNFFSPRQQFPYPQQQPPSGTPLSGIPEQAVHAQSFQPPNMMGYPPNPYYAPYAVPPQNYYYPSGPAFAQMPMYQPQQNYMLSTPTQQPPPQPSVVDAQQAAAPSGMVAHESNGMVFYMPAGDAAQQPAQGGSAGADYQPAESFVPSYAMPGLLPPTPGPEPGGQPGFYYPSGSAGGFYAGGQ
ncbi:unnamed protein product [Zymoseptoria tritici ST99CH_1A5]|uniref:Btz domain-containing protein n=1 Tax=Zymoseptoria tritici ST99CH_1A5 TaxID=1276529 RepID=A0A1Y6L658_ZYMTR|nr:unnamed protein product [Zymoseptoria tritici ST99CH_1A5]